MLSWNSLKIIPNYMIRCCLKSWKLWTTFRERKGFVFQSPPTNYANSKCHHLILKCRLTLLSVRCCRSRRHVISSLALSLLPHSLENLVGTNFYEAVIEGSDSRCSKEEKTLTLCELFVTCHKTWRSVNVIPHFMFTDVK